LNLRPSGPKPDALPGCATPRNWPTITADKEYFKDKIAINFTDFEIILLYKKL
tara:strand:+ start:549 stop:707 length:159 start_codon:yes stop_codon:yes gene_type:complete